MASLRPAELAESARIIGFDEVVMLGYRDSGMAGTPPNEHPESFDMADIDEATGRLVAVIRRTRPQVILTYGDDQRGYPHPDHLRVHDISVLAFDRAGDPDWYPELGEPFQPSKLYYSTWSRARTLAVHEFLFGSRRQVAVRREVVLRVPTRTTGSPPASTSATTSTPAPSRCGPTPPRSTRPRDGGSPSPTPSWSTLYPWEDWILARSVVGPIPDGPTEDDLFAGVRDKRPERAMTRSSTASSSARRTSASRAPTTPSSCSPCRSTSSRPTTSTPRSRSCRAG